MNRIRLLCFFLAAVALFAKDNWTELNIGPFYVDTDGDAGDARDALTQLEQLRWVLGGLLESQNLQSVWPLRVILSDLAKTNPTTSGTEFVLQNGQYVLLTAPKAHLPLGQVAIILLEANTPRMPPDVEYGLQQLFDTLEAHGSRVTWGGKPAHADLNWARIQLFATKFEYGTSFHIFLNALKGGSTIRTAEHNAFAKDAAELEREATANLAKGDWQPVSVSGRPLDPKHDFGEHSLDSVIARVYIADTQLSAEPNAAGPAYQAAADSGGAAAALGYAGLAQIAKLNRQDATSFLESAMRAGSRSAPVYVALAADADAAEATPLLKKAVQLNPLWAEPVFRQAQFASGEEKGAFLKRATQLDPRISQYWVELAQWQALNGHASAAPGSWLRAEDSARNEAERARIHQLRMDSEEQRLDAADRERRREREELHQADQRAQNAEMQRIHAAEQKANQGVNAEAQSAPAGEVVPWSSLVPQKKLQGLLIKVDCLHSGARLAIKNRAGQVTELFLADTVQTKLACGVQSTPRPVSLSYAAQPDQDRRTAGNITEIAWR